MKQTYVLKIYKEGLPSLLVRLLDLLGLKLYPLQPKLVTIPRRRFDDYKLHSHTRRSW